MTYVYKTNIRYQTKVFLAMVVLVLAVCGAMLLLTHRLAWRDFQARAGAAADLTRHAVDGLLRDRLDRLSSRLALLPATGADRPLLLREGEILFHLQHVHGSWWTDMIPAAGLRFDATTCAQLGTIAPGQTWRGHLVVHDVSGPALLLASAYREGNADGVTVLAERVNAQLIRQVAQRSLGRKNHLAVLVGEQLIATSLPSSAWDALRLSTGVASAGEQSQPWDQGRRPVRIGDLGRYYAASVPLTDLGLGGPNGRARHSASYVLLVSDEALNAQWHRLQSGLVAICLVGLVLALVLARTMSIALSRPIQALVEYVQHRPQADGTLLNPRQFTGEFRALAVAFADAHRSLSRTAQRLAESERMYRTLIEGSALAITGISIPTGCLFAGNRAFARLVGCTPEALIRRRLADLLFDPQHTEVDHILTNLLEHNEVRSRLRLRTDDGCERWVEFFACVVSRSPQVEALAILTDVTEKRVLELQLAHAQKMESLGVLVRGIAHQLNNPLNGIINYGDLLAAALNEDPRLERYAHNIVREGTRMAEIIRSLQLFARAERKPRSPARLCDLVARTLAVCSAQFQQSSIQLDLDVPENLPMVRCSWDQIQQVLLNLLLNAMAALNERYPEGHPNKWILIAGQAIERHGQPWLRLRVEDQGCGIPEEHLPRLFDPFFTTRTDGPGTGLGLSVAHGIVADHGGTLTIESVPGCGTRVCVDLPLHGGDVPRVVTMDQPEQVSVLAQGW